MKKRKLIWIIAIIIFFLILISLFVYSKYKTSSQESEGTLNTLFNVLSFISVPFIPKPPFSQITLPREPPSSVRIEMPDNPLPPEVLPPIMNRPEEPEFPDIPEPNIQEPPPDLGVGPTPTIAPPKPPLYDFWKKFWEIYQKFPWFVP